MLRRWRSVWPGPETGQGREARWRRTDTEHAGGWKSNLTSWGSLRMLSQASLLISTLSIFIQERCAQPRHRALLKRRSLFVQFTSFVESSFPKAQKRAPTTASNFRKYAPRIDDKSHQKGHKWTKIVVWEGLGAVWAGSWSPAGPKARPDAL